MLFNLYTGRPRPVGVDSQVWAGRQVGENKWDQSRDWSCTTDVLTEWSEIPRPEYNYVFNRDGLRSVEFAKKPNVLALGCSITIGQGLPVEKRWSDLLQEKLCKHGSYVVGNLAYGGASAAKSISSFFSLINTYKYLPEIVVCNFANFERLWFSDSFGNHMQDYYLSHKKVSFSASAPYEYGKIIPMEQAYFTNLDHIKMLEAFCWATGIKLYWSTWSTNLSVELEYFLKEHFSNYHPDPTRAEFPPEFEYSIQVANTEQLPKYYKMKNWDRQQCHIEESSSEIFDYAYDYHNNPGCPWGGAIWPHPGLHRHLHWAEFYYDLITKDISN